MCIGVVLPVCVLVSCYSYVYMCMHVFVSYSSQVLASTYINILIRIIYTYIYLRHCYSVEMQHAAQSFGTNQYAIDIVNDAIRDGADVNAKVCMNVYVQACVCVCVCVCVKYVCLLVLRHTQAWS